MENDLFITNKASEYAKVFTEDYIKNGPEDWENDALKWFAQFNVNQEERNAFIKKCKGYYDYVYIQVFGKEDDYYDLALCIKQLEDIQTRIRNIQSRDTLKNNRVTFNDVCNKLIYIQSSLRLLKSSINRKYKFESNE